MSNLYYPYSRPNVTENDIKSVVKVLRSQYLAQGSIVKNFENEISKKFNVKNTVVCNSGTAALHSVYKCLGLNNKNGLITTPITFLATANAAKMCNAPIYFADVDKETGLMTPDTLEKAFKEVSFKVRIVTIVHLGGHLCDLEGLSKIAKKHNCLLVEDACHAIGAKYYKRNKKNFFIGSCDYSIATTFSFHAIKNITMGEGGCITTNDKKLAESIRLNICHGMIRDKKKMKNISNPPSWYYQMNDIGWNYRASEISCALGLSQFKRLEKIINEREKIARYYMSALKRNIFIKLPKCNSHKNSVGWHLYQLKINFTDLGKSRESFVNYLEKKSIGSQVHYIPLVYHPYYKNSTKIKSLNGAIEFYKSTISIPMYTGLKKRCVMYIAKVINNFFEIK